MYFSDFLKKSADEINIAIEDFLANWYKEIDQTSPRLSPLVRTLGTATIDGKRIRGALVLLGYTLSGKSSHADLVKIAVAYELFQTAILAHDDIIDSSPTRRGNPSLHMALGGQQYGISQAICLGDIGFFLAYQLIAESTFDDKLKSEAIAFFSKSIIQTIAGEMLDVELPHSRSEITQEDVLTVARMKTAYYTFVAPLTVGAILGGTEGRIVDAIATFGHDIGIAFQLQDDYNDIFGTEEKLKKPPGGDVREGKATVLFLHAKQKADDDQLQVLKHIYGKGDATADEITLVKDIFIKTGASDYTQSLIKEYSEKAEVVIPEITDKSEYQTLLKELIEYVVK